MREKFIKIYSRSRICTVIQLDLKNEIPSFPGQKESFVCCIICYSVQHIVSKIIRELLVYAENIIFLLLNQLRQVPFLYQDPIALSKLVYVIKLIVICQDVLPIYHLYFIEENIIGLYFSANDSHNLKSVSCSVELTNVNVLAPIADVKIVFIMSDAPSLSYLRWQGNLCFKLRIKRWIEVFKDNKYAIFPSKHVYIAVFRVVGGALSKIFSVDQLPL